MADFILAEDTGFWLRLALLGPSGSGKSYTALKVATELGFEKVGIIDTENRSARRYARSFARRFHTLELSNFSPKDYIEALRKAQAAGMEVVVIDSLSHAWMGKGGVLEMVDQSARRQARGGHAASFNGWREVTPEHNRLVDALIQAPLHLIITMRVKTEYVVEKTEGGKSVPKKVGMAPVQRDGLEYEFDVIGDMELNHDLVITKSRCTALSDAVISRPGKEMAETLRAWLDGAGPPPKAEPSKEGIEGGRERIQADERKGEPERHYEDNTAAELAAIKPWLERIETVRQHGDEQQLDQVRAEMNEQLRRKTKLQGTALRTALDEARADLRRAHAEPQPVKPKDDIEQLREDLAAATTTAAIMQAVDRFEQRLQGWKDEKSAATLAEAGRTLAAQRMDALGLSRGGDET